ncbi:response regulator [Sphingomonas sinipercae]|uniref:histidine kinase n=1 Tax=Sphingomonas sinipercae TaxID=2714944 RepID=A0A6G7ZQT7_9SPHN|nr:response regulator [Sphingomonas sinipercae]
MDVVTDALGDAAPVTDQETGERPRVLVVDDDQRNLLAIETVLEDVGEVVTASSGEEALRQLLRGEFAVILLDVFMPGLDGYETAQIIRSRDQSKRIPIIFLSAVNKENEHLIRGYSMGAVDYVFKPVEAVVLRSKVAVFVDLFAKTKEIERKARHEQALLDATLRANAEKLKAEQNLRQAEQRQAAIIQSLPIVLYLEPLGCDPRCPKFVSGDLHAMTGYSFAEVIENPTLWGERLHPDDRHRVLDALAERERTGRLSVEYRWRCADDSYKHFHDQAVLLKDPDGRPHEFAGTLTDVTERRLLESQLVQAQKMDAIGKLTGGIAHDFNNLLAAVLGGLGLIERRAELSDEHRRILTMTRRAADQGSELVRRLLAFSRQQQLEPAAIDMHSLHEGVDELLTHTLGGLVELDWQIAKDAWCAFADRSQLELALMNLVINARDAMPDGGTISVLAENREVTEEDPLPLAGGNYVVVSVVDAGSGIAPDLLEKVLEPFFTTKEVGKGTGLGLSMVYGFAKQSGGTLRLTSEVGKGTTAELWLPRAAENEAPAAKRSSDIDDLEPQGAFKVLLIDDHPEVRGTTAAMLADLGHQAVEVSSGSEAIALLERDGSGVDLVITDYAMPRQSGTEVVRVIREQHPELPAIIVTGYADENEIGERPSDVDLLMKPFSLSDISGAIRRAMAPKVSA